MDTDILVVCRGLEVGVESHHLGDEGVTLFFNLLAGAILPGVQPLAFTVVDGLRGGRPGGGGGGRQKTTEDITVTLQTRCTTTNDHRGSLQLTARRGSTILSTLSLTDTFRTTALKSRSY